MKTCNCTHCSVFRILCEGCTWTCRYRGCDGQCLACPVRCHRRSNLDEHLDRIGGLDLNLPLLPQPAFRLARYFPQLLNGLDLRSPLQRETDLGVGIAKVLTPSGRASRRAWPQRPGPASLRTQWGIDEHARLICIGNDKDDHLEKLWAAQLQNDAWMQVRILGFDLSTSLNFSIYLDEPRLEHLISIKRTWFTVARMQQTSPLIPIPHLQWATLLDVERQLDLARERGFHTLTLNLQIAKRQAWDPIQAGLDLVQEQAPDLRLLFAGVVGLKRLAALARAFPAASFTSTTPHFLAQRRVRLQRDGTRLIKEPVHGHVDLILAENIRLYQDFLAGPSLPDTRGRMNSSQSSPRTIPIEEQNLVVACREVIAALRAKCGQSLAEATATCHRLATDQAILTACRDWLREGALDRSFRGSFPMWPCAESVPHPTLGEILDAGLDPLHALLRLADLAEQVDEEIAILAAQAEV